MKAAPATTRTPKSPSDPILARQRQVEMLIASHSARGANRVPWPQASKSTIEAWNARHGVFSLTSANWRGTQARMLFLADYPANDQFAAFEAQCLHRNLAPTTALTYWIAFQNLRRILDPSILTTAADTKIMRIMKSRATRFPVAFPTPLTALHMKKLLQSNTMADPIVVLIVAAWLLGQRISDAIQWSADDITLRENGSVIIVVRRFKTWAHNPPYTLVIAKGSIANAVMNVARKAKKAGRVFLWTGENLKAEQDVVKQKVALSLLSVEESLELRSIRRGGLQHAASQGHTLDQILLLSQHKDIDMLRRYLNWGTASAALIENLSKLATTQEEAIAPYLRF